MADFTADSTHDPKALREYVRAEAIKQGLDPDQAEAVLAKESSYGQNNFAPGGGGWGARGPMQVRKIAMDQIGFTGDPNTLFNPEVSVPLALRYLKKYGLSRYGGTADYPAQIQAIQEGLKGGQGGSMSMSTSSGGGQDFSFGGGLPGMAAAMKWIQAGQDQGPEPDWTGMINQADQNVATTGANFMNAGEQLGPGPIAAGMAATQPQGQVGADTVERLFSNLATTLTGNPGFAQNAVASQEARETERRQSLIQKNIAAYQRAGDAYEKAGQYAQAVKMRRLELAERKRQDELQTRTELAKEGMRGFWENQREYAKLGYKLNGDGTLDIIKGMNILSKGTILEADEWHKHMDALTSAAGEAAKIKDGTQRGIFQQDVTRKRNILAATPYKGQTAEQFALQISQYMGSDTSPEDMAAYLRAGLEAHPEMDGAKELLEAHPRSNAPAPTEAVKPQASTGTAGTPEEKLGDLLGTGDILGKLNPFKGDVTALMSIKHKTKLVMSIIEALHEAALEKMAQEAKMQKAQGLRKD